MNGSSRSEIAEQIKELDRLYLDMCDTRDEFLEHGTLLHQSIYEVAAERYRRAKERAATKFAAWEQQREGATNHVSR